MELFQILDCSSLGTCCKDYSILGVLQVTKVIFGLIQFVVPIILIVAGTIQFLQLTINPELKDGFRRVLNKFMAAVIIFLLPTLVDVFLTATSENFTISACWNQIDLSNAKSVFGGNYASVGFTSVWLDTSQYEKTLDFADTKKNSINSVNSNKIGGTKQQQIVSYAKEFVGEGYKYGGRWNGEKPYHKTDCIGFVKGVYTHFGFKSMKNAPQGTNSFYKVRHNIVTEVSESDLEPGDIVLWKGHVALYTGKGRQIIHAAGKKYGVIVSKDYRKSSSSVFRGFYRVKGVK